MAVDFQQFYYIIKLTYEVNRGDILEITFKTNKLEKTCTIASETKKAYGNDMAELIHRRLDQIASADTIDILLIGRIGRCHALHDESHNRRKRKNQYAMDLTQPYRLVFELIDNKIQIANIVSIEDYH